MSNISDVCLYVPARNAQATLKRSLDSVKRLDPQPAHAFVLLDETSSDQTSAIAHASGLEIVIQRSPGLSAARNEAVEHAQHPWVASLDADVVAAQDWLGKLVDMRQQNPDLAALCGRTEETLRGPGDLWRALMHPHHWGRYPLRGPFMLISEALMSREAVLSVGGYREALMTYGEDSRLSRDLRDAGYRLGYTPFARAAHIRHDGPRQALDLRWQYARPRAQHQLEDLSGLLQKTAKNLEFAQLASARAHAWKSPELGAMAALLPFHHATSDLRELLQTRRVPAATAAAMRSAAHRTFREIAQRHGLRDLYDVLAAPSDLPHFAAISGGVAWPAFRSFLESSSTLIESWVAVAQQLDTQSINFSLFDDVSRRSWTKRCGAPDEPELTSAKWPALWSISPTSTPEFLVSTMRCRGDKQEIILTDEGCETRHLIVEALSQVEELTLHYRPSRSPQTSPLSAGELAELFAEAGFEIVDFETLGSETTIIGRHLIRSGSRKSIPCVA